MSGRGEPAGARTGAPIRTGPTVAVAVAAALVALALGGQGLLVPAGPVVPLVRVGGGGVALLAVGLLLRRDGPAQASRTLALVAVAGAVVGLATLPASPVSLDRSLDAPDPSTPAGVDDRTVVLDQAAPPGGGGSTVEVPPGAVARVEDGTVVARRSDGTDVVLAPADPGTVVRSADGTVVVVGHGVLLDVPAALPGEQPAAPDPLDDGVEAVLALLLGTFALLAFSPPLVRLAHRSVNPVVAVDDLDPPSPAPARAVEAGLADVLRAMLADPDPRTAVIGAYARLLVALDEAGMPRRPEEGPHEHLWRALGPLGVRRSPVHQLAELFVRARFTPRPVMDAHRRAAITALADAVADLRLPAPDVDAVAGAHR